MARRKKHEEHENHERWLVSYADFITLLFAFFVVMYSVSAINEGKYRVLSKSLSTAFSTNITTGGGLNRQIIQLGQLVETKGGPPSTGPVSIEVFATKRISGGENTTNMGASNQGPQGQRGPIAEQGPKSELGKGRGSSDSAAVAAIKEIAEKIENKLGNLAKQGLVHVRRDEYFLEVEISSSILFNSGSAKLSAASTPILGHIADILRPLPNPVRVEGYTDNMPINIDLFPSNWELSTGRASSVVRLLANDGVDPVRLSAIGYGEFRPVADNRTEQGRRKNRRVVLVIQAGENVDKIINATQSGVRDAQGHLIGGIFKPESPGQVVEEKPAKEKPDTEPVKEKMLVKKTKPIQPSKKAVPAKNAAQVVVKKPEHEQILPRGKQALPPGITAVTPPANITTLPPFNVMPDLSPVSVIPDIISITKTARAIPALPINNKSTQVPSLPPVKKDILVPEIEKKKREAEPVKPDTRQVAPASVRIPTTERKSGPLSVESEQRKETRHKIPSVSIIPENKAAKVRIDSEQITDTEITREKPPGRSFIKPPININIAPPINTIPNQIGAGVQQEKGK